MSKNIHGISVVETNYGSSSTHTLTPCPTGEGDVEKGFGRGGTTVSMPSELFEKLYLTPKASNAGNHTRGFANPTPLGFIGFVISTFTFSMVLLGFGGASGLSPVVGIFLFTGPVLLFVAMIFEWIMGNFFPMMIMGLFTVFWLSFGLLNLPTLELGLPFATPNGKYSEVHRQHMPLLGLDSLWFFLGFALFTFFVFTIRVNFVFAALFFIVSIGAWLLSAAYFKVSNGDYAGAMLCQKAGASLLFVDGILGWYACFAIMAAEMRLPLNLPFGDLSRFWSTNNAETKSE
ncbi:GPR1/FUN34/yaaH family-domain-containing protein [Xylaria curta]|nr:GPR1/FUN34/yaaH family-domain-containing protein [Xylaria curta]